MKKNLFPALAVSGFVFLITNSPVLATCSSCQQVINTPDQISIVDHQASYSAGETIRNQVHVFNGQVVTPALDPSQFRERLRERLSEAQQTRVKAMFIQIIHRLETASEQINRIILRLETRLAKITADDQNAIDEANRQITAAKEELNRLNLLIQEAKSKESEFLDNENPQAAFQTLKTLLKETKVSLQQLRQGLIKIINELNKLTVATKND